jgi:Phage integrase family
MMDLSQECKRGGSITRAGQGQRMFSGADSTYFVSASCVPRSTVGAAGSRRSPCYKGRPLTRTVLQQADSYAMIARRCAAAGIATKVGNHSFRATGITTYLKNGGTLEKAAQMANHASTRTTQLYDRRREELSLDEVERIRV